MKTVGGLMTCWGSTTTNVVRVVSTSTFHWIFAGYLKRLLQRGAHIPLLSSASLTCSLSLKIVFLFYNLFDCFTPVSCVSLQVLIVFLSTYYRIYV